MNKTCGTLLEKQGWTSKWCSSIFPYTWAYQCWLSSKNLHQLCVNTGCSLEDRDGWRELMKPVLLVWLDDNILLIKYSIVIGVISFYIGIRWTFWGLYTNISCWMIWEPLKLAWFYHIYQPLCSGRIWHRSLFKRSLTGLNSEFSFSQTSCLTKAEEPSLSYYLPIAGGRIIGFIPFPRVLVLCEMQSVSSRIWTRVAVSISYDDNHHTMFWFYGISIIVGYLMPNPIYTQKFYTRTATPQKKTQLCFQ